GAAPDAAARLDWFLWWAAAVTDCAPVRCHLPPAGGWRNRRRRSRPGWGPQAGHERGRSDGVPPAPAGVWGRDAGWRGVPAGVGPLRQRRARLADVVAPGRDDGSAPASPSALYARWPWPEGVWAGLASGPQRACRDGNRCGRGCTPSMPAWTGC